MSVSSIKCLKGFLGFKGMASISYWKCIRKRNNKITELQRYWVEPLLSWLRIHIWQDHQLAINNPHSFPPEINKHKFRISIPNWPCYKPTLSSGQLEENYSRLIYTEKYGNKQSKLITFSEQGLAVETGDIYYSLSIKKTRSPTSTDMPHRSGLSVVRNISTITSSYI